MLLDWAHRGGDDTNCQLMHGLKITFIEVRSFEMALYYLPCLLDQRSRTPGYDTSLIQKLSSGCHLSLYWNTAKKWVQGQNNRIGYSMFRDKVQERMSVCKS